RRSSGNARAGSRSPGTHGCRHKRGRALDGSCGRRRFAAPAHTSRRPFFSPALEPQDPRLGIAEDATDRGLRTETGKPIRISQPAWFSHPRIMPVFSPRGEGGNPSKQGVSRPSQAIIYPLGWEKSPVSVEPTFSIAYTAFLLRCSLDEQLDAARPGDNS